MKTTKIIAFILALLWISRIDLAAQEKEFIGIGERIRVTAPAFSIYRRVGTLVALNVDTLLLQAENSAFSRPVVIPLASITRLQVSRGMKSRGKSALKGSAIGFGVVFVPMLVVLAVEESQLDEDRTGDVLVYSLIGGAGGLALGGLIGSQSPGERWERIPVDRIHARVTPKD